MNNENFLNQIDAVKLMHRDFVSSSEDRKKVLAREVLESFIVLQKFLSDAIIDVYKVFDNGVKNEHN